MGADGIELVSKAPTVTIETVLVVRPIKVLATIVGFLAALFIFVSTGASAWLLSYEAREGLWEKCYFTHANPNISEINCGYKLMTDWVKAPQAMSIISLIVCTFAVVVTTLALRTFSINLKYKLYWVALIAFFIAVGFELISLVAFPIKFLQEKSDQQRGKDNDWSFGWAYIMGWAGAICEFSAGLFLLLDRGADEVIYREKVDEGIEDA